MPPSHQHEFLVELFRQQPELARELLRRCAGIEIAGRAELASIDLSQATPVEYRADVVVVARDATGRPTGAIVVEIQLGIDPRKRFSWPVYTTTARANLECPITLLVIAPEVAVAQWAAVPIYVGPGCTLVPTVISYENVPRITDPAEAHALPQLSVISALAHPELDVLRAALHEIDHLGEETSKLYFDDILESLPVELRRILETEMDLKNYEWKSEFARTHRAQGRAEGRMEGHVQGRLELVRQMIELRFGALPDARVAQVAAWSPEHQLRVMLRIATATRLEELFDDTGNA